MSNPNIGFVTIRDGIVERAPEDVPVFNLSILTDDFFGNDMIVEVHDLRNEIATYLDHVDEDLLDDRTYLNALLAECNEWLVNHDDDANDLSERHGVSDAYPNGRCTACGFGLDEFGYCCQSDCANFNVNSPYADAGHTTSGGPGNEDGAANDPKPTL